VDDRLDQRNTAATSRGKKQNARLSLDRFRVRIAAFVCVCDRLSQCIVKQLVLALAFTALCSHGSLSCGNGSWCCVEAAAVVMAGRC